MRKIDLETWPRRKHYKLLSTWEYPHFNMCANVDLTAFYAVVKLRGVSINLAIVYVLARAANELPEFRYRIRGEEVIEHEVVHPSTTIMGDQELFTFCAFDFDEDFSRFAEKAIEKTDYMQRHPSLEYELDFDEYLFMTAIPWVSFTSFMHPIDLNPVDSVPRFAWGKFFQEEDRLKMPLSVQGHHALMDGVHMGRYYEKVQDYFNDPDSVLG
jgi:chloramphenicol O-acetyltransferase type A